MSVRLTIPDDLVIESYQRTGSVHRSGAELGIAHSTVHRRLVKLGLVDVNKMTPADLERIKAEYSDYASTGRLAELAASMGRHKCDICKVARTLGLTDIARSKPWMPALQRGVKKWADRPHPRGALGLKHTAEAKAIISHKSKLNWVTMKTFGIGNMSAVNIQTLSDRTTARAGKIQASSIYSRTKGGTRADIGPIHFRSSWEANYARYLNLLLKLKVIEAWEYEPETFWFLKIMRGVRSYRPDFLVQYKGEAKPVYVEVKGWMDPKSKTKIARFKKYYPQHKLEVVDQKQYKAISAKWRSAIPLWEGK